MARFYTYIVFFTIFSQVVAAADFSARKNAQAQTEAPEIITNPQGTVTHYDRVAQGWYIYAGGNQLQYGRIPGLSTMVRDGNTMYIKNPLTANETGAYIKCSVEGNKITAKLPQVLAMLQDGSNEFPLYIGLMNPQDYQGLGITYAPAADNDQISWTLNADGTITMDHDPVLLDSNNEFVDGEPRGILGTYYYWPNEQGQMEAVWNGVGDWEQTYTPIQEQEVCNVPEGLIWQDWQMETAKANRIVKVAFDGQDIYLLNITQYAQGALKGKVEGDKVSFPNGQYLGFYESKGANVWFISAQAVYDSYDFGDFVMTFIDHFDRTDALTFDYDCNHQLLSSGETDCFIINASLGETNMFEYQVHPVITYLPVEGMDAKPQNPIITEPGRDEGSDGYYFECVIPAVNIDGVTLNTNQMYYNIYLNGELWTFYPDTFFKLTEEMTDVPYNFTENWDFKVEGTTHGIYFHAEGIENIGVVSCFRGNDGQIYKSDRVNTADSGIADISLSQQVASMAYFNISGQRLEHPTPGLIICVTTYADGHVATEKIIYGNQ